MTRDREAGPHTDNADENTPKRGRPPGSRNKRNILIEQMGVELANGSVREIIFGVFDLMGGLAGLLKWAEKNPDKFYQNVWKSMGPRSAQGRRVTAPRRDAPESGDVEIEDFTDGE